MFMCVCQNTIYYTNINDMTSNHVISWFLNVTLATSTQGTNDVSTASDTSNTTVVYNVADLMANNVTNVTKDMNDTTVQVN